MMRVIVADDDESSRYMMTAMLRAVGHEPVPAEDGVEALRLARQEPPDLIVSDILMPTMDGYQLCREWRADEALAQVPFVFYTANYTDVGDERFAKNLGADRFLIKPMDPHKLLNELERLLQLAETGVIEPHTPEVDESEILREYNTRLVHKLEQQIEELRTSNESLAQTQGNLSRLVETAPVGIITISATGKVLMWNPAAEKMFGWSSEELLGRTCPLIEQPSGVECIQLLKAVNAPVSGHETEFRAKDGHLVEVSVSAAPFPGEGDDGLLAIITDVTLQHATKDDLEATIERLSNMMEGTVNAIAKIVEARDPYTSGHQERVAALAEGIAQEMGLPGDAVEGIRVAGLIHDIGKVYVPAEILAKPRRLTDVEFSIVKMHPEVAYDVLGAIEFPWPIATYVVQHHERLDGSGYLGALRGDSILLGSRILAVADVVEAMSSHRPYKVASGIDAALEEIESGAGSRYDEKAVRACVTRFRTRGLSLDDLQVTTLA
ncbi:MAG: response regulator [Actinomycetota bacterium]|nr:response regulator [Actinomycetota bacterium]